MPNLKERFEKEFDVLDREPIWRKVEDRLKDRAHDIRNRPGQRVTNRFPNFEHRNFGGGKAIGTLEAGIAFLLKETVGLPLGSDVEVSDVEPTQGGNIYTVNVDAPFENMAEAQAFFEAGTGYASLLTDLMEVQETEVLRTRSLRDTYQVKVLVRD